MGMMMKTQAKKTELITLISFNLIRGIIPIVLSASFLMSCGVSKTQEGLVEESSRTLSVNKPVAYCNQATDAAKSMTANVGAFMNASGGVDLNYLHVKLTNVPESFNDNTHYFSLFKWYADAAGTPHTSNQPLSFKIINIQSGQEMASNLTTLSWNTVSPLAKNMGVTTPAQFFQKVRLLVFINDPQGTYDALTIGYHKSLNGVADNRIDALMPAFDADPRDYTANHAKVLANLHPFATTNYSSWTASTFTTKAHEFCTTLSQY